MSETSKATCKSVTHIKVQMTRFSPFSLHFSHAKTVEDAGCEGIPSPQEYIRIKCVHITYVFVTSGSGGGGRERPGCILEGGTVGCPAGGISYTTEDMHHSLLSIPSSILWECTFSVPKLF